MSETAKICGSRGPRIGSEGQPICKREPGHQGEHCPSLDDGWGDSMSWSDPWRDPRPVTAAVPLVERLAEALARHRIAVWSDHTYGCRSCAKRHEQTAEPFEMGEYARLSKPDWTYEQAMDHLARALLPVVEQAVAEARGEVAAAVEALADESERRTADSIFGPVSWVTVPALRAALRGNGSNPVRQSLNPVVQEEFRKQLAEAWEIGHHHCRCATLGMQHANPYKGEPRPSDTAIADWYYSSPQDCPRCVEEAP